MEGGPAHCKSSEHYALDEASYHMPCHCHRLKMLKQDCKPSSLCCIKQIITICDKRAGDLSTDRRGRSKAQKGHKVVYTHHLSVHIASIACSDDLKLFCSFCTPSTASSSASGIVAVAVALGSCIKPRGHIKPRVHINVQSTSIQLCVRSGMWTGCRQPNRNAVRRQVSIIIQFAFNVTAARLDSVPKNTVCTAAAFVITHDTYYSFISSSWSLDLNRA